MIWKKNQPLPIFPANTELPAALSPPKDVPPQPEAVSAPHPPPAPPVADGPIWIAAPLPPQASWRRVNGWFLLALLLVSAGLGVGVYFLHEYQVKRKAGALLHQADLAEQQQKPQNQIHYLKQYLAFEPQDHDARVRLGKAMEAQAKNGQQLQDALLVFEEVVRLDPHRPDIADVRKRAARLALGIGSFNLAQEHLDILLKETTDDGELEFLAGFCEPGHRRYAEAVSWFEKAIRHAPQQVESYLVID